MEVMGLVPLILLDLAVFLVQICQLLHREVVVGEEYVQGPLYLVGTQVQTVPVVG